ncbi:MAG TPA: ATPase, partial [Treponemataceae bacterium]|nr:ATPase [Treponemataceae bacterium]
MARTTAMRLVELMILKEDISRVLEYLGKKENFQFQSHLNEDTSTVSSKEREMFESLQQVRSYLGISDLDTYLDNASLPNEGDYDKAQKIISTVDLLREKEIAALDVKKRVDETYQEALAFSNLKLPYSEIE